MTDLRKAAEMAFNALLLAAHTTRSTTVLAMCAEATDALRQALAQSANQSDCGHKEYKPFCQMCMATNQEPVAWHSHNPDYPIQDGDWVEVIFTSGQPDDVKKWTPLYTAPQKPDVTLISEGKTWQGLTDDEIELCREKAFSINNPYCPVDRKSMWKAAQYIQAKLREKNT